MDLTKITEADFMCEPNRCHRDKQLPPSWAAVQFLAKDAGKLVWQVTDDYAIHRLGRIWGDVVALFQGRPVGIYSGQVLSVHPGHCCRELATAMIIAAVPYRAQPDERYVTDLGEKALRRAWRVAHGGSTSLSLSARQRRFRVVEQGAMGTAPCVLETDDLQEARDKCAELEAFGKNVAIEKPID